MFKFIFVKTFIFIIKNIMFKIHIYWVVILIRGKKYCCQLTTTAQFLLPLFKLKKYNSQEMIINQYSYILNIKQGIG